MKKTWMAVAVLAMSATMVVAAPGKDGNGERNGDGKRGFSAIHGRRLELTETQRKQIELIEQTSREENREFLLKARDTHNALRKARKAGDEREAAKLAAELEKHTADLKKIRAAELEKIQEVLTDQQKAEYAAIKAKRAAGEDRNREGKKD